MKLSVVLVAVAALHLCLVVGGGVVVASASSLSFASSSASAGDCYSCVSSFMDCKSTCASRCPSPESWCASNCAVQTCQPAFRDCSVTQRCTQEQVTQAEKEYPCRRCSTVLQRCAAGLLRECGDPAGRGAKECYREEEAKCQAKGDKCHAQGKCEGAPPKFVRVHPNVPPLKATTPQPSPVLTAPTPAPAPAPTPAAPSAEAYACERASTKQGFIARAGAALSGLFSFVEDASKPTRTAAIAAKLKSKVGAGPSALPKAKTASAAAPLIVDEGDTFCSLIPASVAKHLALPVGDPLDNEQPATSPAPTTSPVGNQKKRRAASHAGVGKSGKNARNGGGKKRMRRASSNVDDVRAPLRLFSDPKFAPLNAYLKQRRAKAAAKSKTKAKAKVTQKKAAVAKRNQTVKAAKAARAAGRIVAAPKAKAAKSAKTAKPAKARKQTIGARKIKAAAVAAKRAPKVKAARAQPKVKAQVKAKGRPAVRAKSKLPAAARARGPAKAKANKKKGAAQKRK